MSDKTKEETPVATEKEETEATTEKAETTEKKEGGKKGEGKKRERKPREPREEVIVTLETVIPELPKKSQRIAKPDKKKVEAEVARLDVEVENYINKITEIKNEIISAISGLKNKSAGNRSLIDEKTQKLTERKEIKTVRDAKKAESDELKAQSDLYTRENETLRKKIRYFDADTTNKMVTNLKNRLESEQMPLAEEKRLVQELRHLECSLPHLEQYLARQEKIKGLRDQQNVLRKEIARQRDEMQVLTDRINEIDKMLDAFREMRAKEKEQEVIPGSNAKIQEARDQIKKYKQKKQDAWNNFREKTDQFYQQKRQIEHIEWMQRQKDRLVRNAERAEREEEERKLQAPDVPFAYEMELCQNLIDYCRSLKPETAASGDADSKEETKEISTDEKFTGQFKGLQAVSAKRDTDDDYFAAGGKKRGKKSKKGGNQGAKGSKSSQLLNHDLEVTKNFTFLKVFVPGTTDQLDEAIKALEEKLADFKTRIEEGSKDEGKEKKEEGDDKEETKPAQEKKKESKSKKKVDLNTANAEEWPTF